MSISHHHVGLRVSDIERSATFYEQALGARRRTRAWTIDGDFARMVSHGPEGTSCRTQFLELDDGGCVELFEFDFPSHPTELVPQYQANVMHFALRVDDVDATLERVERAGGRRFWPEPIDMSRWRIVYVTDPDNNVIELMDATIDDVVALVAENFPE